MMKPGLKWLTLGILTLPLACSSQSVQSQRGLASAQAIAETNPLASLLAEEDPMAAAHAKMDRLLRIRLRAQAYLEEFDAALESKVEGRDNFALPAYRNLLAARPLAEEAEDEVVTLYRLAKESGSLPGDSASGKGSQVLAGLNMGLLEVLASDAKRAVLQDFLGELRLENRQIGLNLGLPGVTANTIPNPAEKSSPSREEELKRLVRELPPTDDIKEEIEKNAEAWKPEGTRGPSAARHMPSAGPAGNIMGFDFPRGTYALTFDDGPHGTITSSILANLKAAGVKATFFWIASYALRHPDIVKKVQAAGMSVQNHSFTHANVTSRRDLRRLDTTVEREIISSTATLTKIYGQKPRFFRLPYAAGMDDPEIRQMIARQGMIHVKWNIDSVDWQDKNPVTVLRRVERQMQENERGIILFHDVQAHTIRASRDLLARKKGQVRWVTIPEITDQLNAN